MTRPLTSDEQAEVERFDRLVRTYGDTEDYSDARGVALMRVTDEFESLVRERGDLKAEVEAWMATGREAVEAVNDLKAENARLRDTLDLIAGDVAAMNAGRTHWEGCEATHRQCAIARRIAGALSGHTTNGEQGR